MVASRSTASVVATGVLCHFLASFVVTVSASSGTCDDLSALLPAAGGWMDTDPEDEDPWYKGGEYVPCTGPCYEFNATHPYLLEDLPAGQTIADPTNEWFTSDSYTNHWCMTGETYATTGGTKKQWGYCTCAKLCGDINNEDNCKATFYTPDPSPCVFSEGTCQDAPDCAAANSVFGANSLKNKCGNDPTCTFASGACHFTPTTCAGVNSIFTGVGAAKKKSCLDNVEGCYYHGGECLVIPDTCTAVQALKGSMALGKFQKLCKYSDEGCYLYQNDCFVLPPGCAGVNNDATIADVNRDGNKFKEICELVDGCSVYDSTCQRTPDSCDDVNGAFNAASSTSSACNSVSNENCALVDGECASVECSHYHIAYSGNQKRNKCNAAADCTLLKGRCCDSDTECFGYDNGPDCSADTDCEWKGPNGKKKCTCAYDTGDARRL